MNRYVLLVNSAAAIGFIDREGDPATVDLRNPVVRNVNNTNVELLFDPSAELKPGLTVGDYLTQQGLATDGSVCVAKPSKDFINENDGDGNPVPVQVDIEADVDLGDGNRRRTLSVELVYTTDKDLAAAAVVLGAPIEVNQ